MMKFITGTMKSGKSERLIEEIEKEHLGKFSTLIIKPISDTRDGAFVKTRAHERKYPALLIDENDRQMVELLLKGVESYCAIFIDESQFFSREFIEKLSDYCETYCTDLIASGLLYDFKGEHFPSSVYLYSHSDKCTMHYGDCDYCGDKGVNKDILVDSKTNRIIGAGNNVKPEGTDQTTEYKTICKKCYKGME